MHQEIALDIIGYNGGEVPHRFLRREQETDHLAVVLPGRAYGPYLPFLLYPIRLFQEEGADVLVVDYTPYTAEMTSNEEMYRRLNADVPPALDAALGGRLYSRVTILGKSLGTLVMGDLLERDRRFRGVSCIWMTPLLRSERLRSQIAATPHRALFIGGTADEQFDSIHLAELERATGGGSLSIEGANHVMEVPGDVLESIRGLERTVERIAQFIE